MTLSRIVGDQVSLTQLQDAVRAAVLAAGRGRSTFELVWPVTVLFTIVDGRTDVAVSGLEKDDPEIEYRHVGGSSYLTVMDYRAEPPTSAWASTSPNQPEAEPVLCRVGTPLALLDAMTGATAEVVSSDADTTTYAVRIRRRALDRAFGDLQPDLGRDAEDDRPPVLTEWTLAAGDLPLRVEATDDTALYGWDLAFSDWGTAPAVTPPDGEVVDLLDWETRGEDR